MNLFLEYQKKIFNSLKNLEKKKLIRIPPQSKSITVEGVDYPSILEASKHYGLDRSVVDARINQLGWEVEKAFKTPVKKQKGVC